jgi:hypothetical protein
VTLRDSTIFPVFDADLYAGGKAFLDKLVAVVANRRSHIGDEIPKS